LTSEFLQQLARLIEYALPALGSDDQRFSTQAHALLAMMRQPNPDAIAIKNALATFTHRVSFAAEEQTEIKNALLNLLQLIFENIGELALDNSWLQGQIEALVSASAPPLSLRRLDDVGVLLKDVIHRQTEAKGRAMQAQHQLRSMLSTFIERLGSMAQSSSGFHDQIVHCAKEISQAASIEEIAPVLATVTAAAQVMSQDSRQMRDELTTMRQNAEASQQQILQLHEELDRISAQARHDPLTGTLNRKGLDESMQRDVSDSRRKKKPLSVSLLDIDNFKKINDGLGHAAGDAALTHLAQVARETLRPQDSIARYGGEEFVILMPDTPLDAGIEAMTRVQRELSKRFFLEGDHKVLITFSAGVAEMAPDEEGSETIKRADQAMFLAKRAGKNRVLGA
jgi:diguanylate cyclase